MGDSTDSRLLLRGEVDGDDGHVASFLLPTGTVTFLLTDVEGSTSTWEAAPEAMAKAIDRHYEILADVIGRHRGVRPVEQGEGDSIVAAFSRAADAVAAALEAQQRFTEEPWPAGAALTVRMALHTGDAQLRDAFNYFGPVVIRCARLRSLAHGGQVLATGALHDVAGPPCLPGPTWRDLGEQRLKDLSRPERVYQLTHVSLRDDFPALRGLDATPNNLPAQVSSFVGRDPELAAIHALLDRPPLDHAHRHGREWQDPTCTALGCRPRCRTTRRQVVRRTGRTSRPRPRSTADRGGTGCPRAAGHGHRRLHRGANRRPRHADRARQLRAPPRRRRRCGFDAAARLSQPDGPRHEPAATRPPGRGQLAGPVDGAACGVCAALRWRG